MTAVDTSALLTILFGEPERDQFRDFLEQSPDLLMNAGTLIEARIVTRRRNGDPMVQLLEQLIESSGILIVPVDEAQAAIAQTAFVRFGKGSGHAAQLNFGDLFSYALAKSRNIPLLFKGQDFSATDLVPALSAQN